MCEGVVAGAGLELCGVPLGEVVRGRGLATRAALDIQETCRDSRVVVVAEEALMRVLVGGHTSADALTDCLIARSPVERPRGVFLAVDAQRPRHGRARNARGRSPERVAVWRLAALRCREVEGDERVPRVSRRQ